MRTANFRLLGIVGLALVAACSEHYDVALRDIALPPDQRLSLRVASLEESATRALEALEAGADAVRAGGAERPMPPTARQVRLVNDADAAVFEYSRHVLMVTDVAPTADGNALAEFELLRTSMLAAQRSLEVAKSSLRAYEGEHASEGSSETRSVSSSDQGTTTDSHGSSTSSSSSHSNSTSDSNGSTSTNGSHDLDTTPGPDTLDGRMQQAKADVAAVLRHAKAVITAAGGSSKVPAVSGPGR